jgi:hypothetical protein
MQSKHLHEDRSAIPVVAGMVDLLETPGRRHASPEMRGVVRLDDVLAPIPQRAVAEEKT